MFFFSPSKLTSLTYIQGFHAYIYVCVLTVCDGWIGRMEEWIGSEQISGMKGREYDRDEDMEWAWRWMDERRKMRSVRVR
jgi:hypothetical protein